MPPHYYAEARIEELESEVARLQDSVRNHEEAAKAGTKAWVATYIHQAQIEGAHEGAGGGARGGDVPEGAGTVLLEKAGLRYRL